MTAFAKALHPATKGAIRIKPCRRPPGYPQGLGLPSVGAGVADALEQVPRDLDVSSQHLIQGVPQPQVRARDDSGNDRSFATCFSRRAGGFGDVFRLAHAAQVLGPGFPVAGPALQEYGLVDPMSRAGIAPQVVQRVASERARLVPEVVVGIDDHAIRVYDRFLD